jgi:predicted alpha/beta hydrolase family esterase
VAWPLHRLVDDLAMWTEDRRPRAPVAFRAGDASPLACFGPLPPLPADAPASGPWRAPSPRPCDGDAWLSAVARPARGARRGTAVLVPPWKVPGLRAVAGWERLLCGAGLDVWTLVPPRHLHRAPRGARSGEGFVSPDLRVLREALEQTVVEIRLLVALARRRGGEVALVGLSLGGLAAALAATAPERADAAALVAPPVDLAAVFAQTRIGRRYRALAERAGAPVPPAALGAALLPFRPDARAPTASRVLVAAAADDAIALPAGALALAAAWRAEVRLYPRGHLTLLFACRAARRDLARFLRGEERRGAGPVSG